MLRIGIMRTTSVRKAALAIAAALVCGLAWGLTGALAGSSSPASTGKIVLRAGWTNDPDSLNPFVGYESSSYEIWHLNYDMLIGYRASDLAPVPELAAAMPTTSADGKTVTFKLRPNIMWQDGQPLTARDVAFTYNRIIQWDLWAMSGYTKGIKNVEATDDLTAVFHLATPKANIIRMWIPILPEHIWKSVPKSTIQDKYPNKPPIIGSGPFQCVEWKNGRYARMVANKSYWRGAPKIDEIIFQTYQNADNMAADLKSGVIDMADGLPAAQFKSLSTDANLKLVSPPTRTFDYLCFNSYTSPNSMGNPVLKDPEFRTALDYAVNRRQLVDVAQFGLGKVGYTILTGVDYGAINYQWEPTGTEVRGFDLEKAKAALDAAGYTDTNGDGVRDYKGKPIKLRLWARSENQFSQDAGRLITAWWRSIGLKIDFQSMDDGVINDHIYNYKGNAYAPDYDTYIWDWVGYADPSDTLVSWTSDQIEYGWNDCCWSNAEYDSLFKQQMKAVDLAKGAYDNAPRRDLIWKMQQVFYADSPYLVLDYPLEREGYNIAKWDGWVNVGSPDGLVFYQNDNIDTYLSVHPKTASVVGGGSGSGWIVGVIVAAVVVVAVVVFLVVRRRGGSAEEI